MAQLTNDTTKAWYQVERREGTFHYQFWLLEQEQTLTYVKSSPLVDKKGSTIANGYVEETALRAVTHEGKREVEVVGWVPSRIGSVQIKENGTFHSYHYNIAKVTSKAAFTRGASLPNQANTGIISGGMVIEMSYESDPRSFWDIISIVGWVPLRIGLITEREDGTYYTFYYYVVRDSSKAAFARGASLPNQANDGTITNGIVIEMSYESDRSGYWDVITVQGWVPWDVWHVEEKDDGVYYTQTYRTAKGSSKSMYERGSQLKNRTGVDITDGVVVQMSVRDELTWDYVQILGWVPYVKWAKTDRSDGLYYMQTYRLAKGASLVDYDRGSQLKNRGGSDITNGVIIQMDVEDEKVWDIVSVTGRVPRWR